MCWGFSHFQLFLQLFVLTKLASISIRVRSHTLPSQGGYLYGVRYGHVLFLSLTITLDHSSNKCSDVAYRHENTLFD